MTQKYDAIIIGAGIIGASIAFELAKKGYKTINVDKLAAAGAGSTINTCAVIRTHYSTLEGTAMAYESYLHWKNWVDYLQAEDERGYAQLNETGLLILLNEERDMSIHLDHHRKLGIPFEEWDTATLHQNMPLLDTQAFYPPLRPDDDNFGKPTGEELTGAIFIPAGGYINDPQLSVHNVQRAAEARGATFRFKTEVTDIRQDHGRVTGITVAGGEKIDAPVIVNAAGPHSFVINRMAGVDKSMKINTRALRHEVHFVPAPEGYDGDHYGHVTSDDDVGGYCRPETGNLLLIGSQDPECDPQEWVEDPDHFDREVSDQQWRAQVLRMAQRIPSLPIPGQARGLVDLYDVSDDWIPIYDKSDLGGFYMAVGTSGNQYKNGPVAGLLMSEVIDACEKGLDHDSNPVQVTCPITGFILDAGFYSRNREINKDSSFSVLG
jgi:sarcosine oxidase subunit beta